MAGSQWRCDVSQRLGHLLEAHDPARGFGTMSASVYDTAWVACVYKTVDGRTRWLFPAAYDFVLRSQSGQGGWPAHADERCASPDEADVLTTLAGLYCLSQHQRNQYQLPSDNAAASTAAADDLAARIIRASRHLSQLLARWDPRATKAVGNEVLVPALLDLLREAGHDFHFEGKPALMQLRDLKLSKVTPQLLYAHAPSSLLHSLEAFHGRADVDFDRFSHHKIGGSMMCSPSATASYLIRRSTWDDEAEEYLRHATSNGAGKSSGAVPSAYPSTYFELTWVASLLLENNLWADSTATNRPREILRRLLERGVASGGGALGFAPGVEVDLDDTSKASTILSLLGGRGLAQSIVARFDGPSHLKTYINERDPSVSANCNALIAMCLDRSQFPGKTDTIGKVVRFVCDTWFDSNGDMKDKWNLSPYYSVMYMTKALNQLLRTWDEGSLPDLPLKLIVSYALPVIIQCAVMLLRKQRPDGSWGAAGPVEETSYAVLALIYILPLPLVTFMAADVTAAIARGRKYLSEQHITSPEYIWVEKVTYGSMHLSDAYRYAACYSAISSAPLGSRASQLLGAQHESTTWFAANMSPDLLHFAPQWLVLASWIESLLLLPHVQTILSTPLPSADDHTEKTHDLFAHFNIIFSKNIAAAHMSARMVLRISAASAVVNTFWRSKCEHEQDGALLFTCRCQRRLTRLAALRLSHVTQTAPPDIRVGLDAHDKSDQHVNDPLPSPSATSISSGGTASTGADLIFSDVELEQDFSTDLPAPACKVPSAITKPNVVCARLIETANSLTTFLYPPGSSACSDESLTSELSRHITDACTPHCREVGESDRSSLLTLCTLLLSTDDSEASAHRRYISGHISRNLRKVLARLVQLRCTVSDEALNPCAEVTKVLVDFEEASLSLGIRTLREVGCTQVAQSFDFLTTLYSLQKHGAWGH